MMLCTLQKNWFARYLSKSRFKKATFSISGKLKILDRHEQDSETSVQPTRGKGEAKTILLVPIHSFHILYLKDFMHRGRLAGNRIKQS